MTATTALTEAEERAWEAALEHPTTPTALLVYADWLEERDDPRWRGVRALIAAGKWPYGETFHPRSWVWWTPAAGNEDVHNSKYYYLPRTWWDRLTQLLLNGYTRVRDYTSAKRAIDDAALAWRPDTETEG